MPLVLAASVRLIYIPGKLFVHGDATAGAHSIAAHATLFRLGIASDLFCGVVLIFLVLAFHRLFKSVDRGLAVLVVILGGVLPAAIYFLNVLNDAAALLLVHGAEFLNVFEPSQRNALAMLFLRLHGQEIVAAEVLWGLWLFPPGTLALRSGFLPRILGIWLILNGLAYLVLCATGLLLPRHEDTVSTITAPIQLGEIAFMPWRLVFGARVRAALTAAS